MGVFCVVYIFYMLKKLFRRFIRNMTNMTAFIQVLFRKTMQRIKNQFSKIKQKY